MENGAGYTPVVSRAQEGARARGEGERDAAPDASALHSSPAFAKLFPEEVLEGGGTGHGAGGGPELEEARGMAGGLDGEVEGAGGRGGGKAEADPAGGSGGEIVGGEEQVVQARLRRGEAEEEALHSLRHCS